MMDRFVVVPAAYLYLLRPGPKGEQVLLQLRQCTGYMDGYWAAAAAGHLEQSESAWDAAHREAREELGIAGVDLAFEFTMQRTQHSAAIDERVDFFFTARSWTGEPAIGEPAKCADLRWWDLAHLPEPLVPHEAYALRSLGGGQAYLTYGFDDDMAGRIADQT